MIEQPERDHPDASRSRSNWITIALLGGLLLLILVIAYFATNRNSDQDKLTGNEIANSTPPASAQKLCTGSATYDLIKHELFRRAAQVRGSDQAAFDQIGSAAVARMENPVMESEDSTTRAANCSGSLSIDLPPGVVMSGDRSTLMADIDYTVQPAADNSGVVVTVRNADPIIQSLATLARSDQPGAAPSSAAANGAEPESPDVSVPQAAPPAARPSVPAPPSSGVVAQPNFDCRTARTSGERAVCSDAGLANLDRAMATEYGRAVAVADADQRDQLRESAHHFYAYRDRCADRQCIADAYAGRIGEIRDIVEGRWQPR